MKNKNNSDSYSNSSLDFCFNITTNLIENNNNNSITPRSILSNIEKVSKRRITYLNRQSDRIFKKGIYKRIYKNNNFSIGEVVYTPKIQNN